MKTTSRIPAYDSPAQFARALHAAGLDFHFDDDPADIVTAGTGGQRTFTLDEVIELRAIVTAWTDEEKEEAFVAALDEIHASNR